MTWQLSQQALTLNFTRFQKAFAQGRDEQCCAGLAPHHHLTASRIAWHISPSR
jgi:hypothetical protein